MTKYVIHGEGTLFIIDLNENELHQKIIMYLFYRNSYENSPYENVLMGTSGPKDTVKQSTIYDDDENYVTMQGQISNRNSAAVEGNYETVEPHTQSQYEYFQP